MMPDHARALRTSVILAAAGGIPSFFLTVALAGKGAWLPVLAGAVATLAFLAIGFRCAYAFDKFRQRRAAMARIGAFAAVLIASSLAAYPAAAQQPQTLARAGAWSAYVAMGQDGAPICGMDANPGPGRHFMVKRIGQQRHLTLHVARDTWRIPRGTRITATMAIGGRTWTGTGTAMTDRMIEWTLMDADVIGTFVAAFRSGLEMRLTFHEGSEAPWFISLAGTNVMTAAFLGCIEAQNEVMRRPPQPTQPFSSGPAPEPTQPGPVTGARERRT